MTKAKQLGRYFSPNVKIAAQTEKSTTFRVVGVPFGGPEWLGGKDLHGEFFDKSNTDLGKDADGNVIVKTIYAYYDHALNDNIGQDRIGFANFYAETDEGQIWDIEVMRAYRYHDMLATLAEKGLLGASSQPVQTAVAIDWESGLIKQWHPAEISLTPTPANPLATAVLKSFDVDLDALLAAKAEGEGADETVEAVGDETPADEPADTPADDGAADPETDPDVEEINNAFASSEGGATDTQEAEVVATDEETLEPVVDLAELAKALMAAIQPAFDALDAKIEAVKTEQTAASGRDRDLATAVQSLKASTKAFAVNVARELKMKVAEAIDDETQSEVEREAAAAAKFVRTTAIPAHAPGALPRQRK